MSDANFYQVLGVGRSASADEIRSAYRELVKKHHPDLFTVPREKDEATAKLREINEAYAVLGNAKRRHGYDQRFIQRPRVRVRAPAAAKRPQTSRPRRRKNLRSKTDKILKKHWYFSKKRAAYTLAAVVVLLIVVYASRSQPRVITAWTLLEKVEVSPPKGVSSSAGAGQGWVPLGQYASVPECAGILKERVQKDEQEGSRAVFGEPNGTMAITVLVTKEIAQARENSNSTVKPDRSSANESALQSEQQLTQEALESPKNGMTKRVRSLECRATQRLTSESRLRRALRKMGLSF